MAKDYSFECVAHGKEFYSCPECSPENFCECCDPPVVRKLCPNREAIDSIWGGKCDGDGSCLKQCSCTCYYYYVNPIDGTVRDNEDLEGIDLEKLIQDAMAGARVSPLHSICWWRVVLDEAQMVFNAASQVLL